MRLIHNPCLKCEDRKVGCHAACEKYAKAKEETAKAKENERIFKANLDYLGEKKRKWERRR